GAGCLAPAGIDGPPPSCRGDHDGGGGITGPDPRECRPMPVRGTAKLKDAPRRARAWAERQDPTSPSGVAISAWRHYRATDRPLQSALLSLYMLVAVIPALLVMEEYLDPHPDSLASSIVRHYNLNAPTARLLHDVLGEGRSHELGSALLAIAGAL